MTHPVAAQLVTPPDNRIEILASGDGTSGTVLFHGEDHTFGNALRYILSTNPSVDFVGYSIPHPSEKVIHLRVQTRGGVSIKQVIADACDLMVSITETAAEQFDNAYAAGLANGAGNPEKEEVYRDITKQNHGMEDVD